jgi:hypothetical protein
VGWTPSPEATDSCGVPSDGPTTGPWPYWGPPPRPPWIEVRHHRGPVRFGVTYRVSGEVVAVGASPRTEYVWYDSRAVDGDRPSGGLHEDAAAVDEGLVPAVRGKLIEAPRGSARRGPGAGPGPVMDQVLSGW